MSEEPGDRELETPGAVEPASVETVRLTLKKVLASGALHRIPRNPEHRDIVLAILCLDMHRRYPYSEVEMNAYLVAALEKFRAKFDHVTCRRYLADLAFVRRDRAGMRYFANFPKLESVLSDAARAEAHQLVAGAVAHGSRRRKPGPRGKQQS
ncbi:MAG: DUF2087 domain-containing protein [Pseudomonadales bacterium]